MRLDRFGEASHWFPIAIASYWIDCVPVRVEVRALACETSAFAFGDRGTHLPGWGTRQTGGKARHALLQVVLPIESDSVIFRFEYNPNPNMWHRLGEGH